MKMLFKQRFFSWLDSYDIYDEQGNTLFTVEGKLDWGHCLHVLNHDGVHVGTVKEVVLTWLPKFELWAGERNLGVISKELTFFSPKYRVECNGWQVEGDFLGWDYSITAADGARVASINKEIWNFTDTYTIEVPDGENALLALMVVLAIDAEKCSRN